MKLSLNWIKDFVDLKGISTQDVVTRLGLSTCEIEGTEERGIAKNVVVGRIVTCEKHPERKKLHVLTVDKGDRIVNVICGAPNCRVGLTVAFAQVGSTIGNINVGKAEIAGYESHGMCLSEHELGISSDHDGIIELSDNLKPGTDLHVAMPGLSDTIIEIDNKSLTNRPDLWGHYGFARELSAIFGRKLKPIKLETLDKFRELPQLPISIENKADCFSFGAIRIENINVPKSPLEMRIRLFYCGINSHEYLVDLSNYIMLELGQPNHAFDLAKVGNKLSIGNIAEGTEFITLKDQEIKAASNMMFIKASGEPVSLAGIMGGKNSSIDAATTGTIFEMATFDATNIRRTSQALGIRSDASTRYEKSLDVNLIPLAAARITQEVAKADKKAKVTSAFTHIISRPSKEIKIKLEKEYLERFAGISFDYNKVKSHLTALGFAPVITAKSITVTIPSWRATKDISNRADVIEEIVRMFGYDNVTPVAPKKSMKPRLPLPHLAAQSRIKDILADKYGMTEVHTYIWNNSATMKELNIDTSSFLSVINSVVAGSEQIRCELGPSLISVISKNKLKDDIAIFEIGRTFSEHKGEQTRLGVALAGKKDSAELYKELSEIITDVMSLVSVNINFNLSQVKQKHFHPRNNANIMVAEKTHGKIGVIHPSVTATIDPKMNITVCEIMLDDLFNGEQATKKMRFNKFPTTTLDFTFASGKPYGDMQSHFDKFKHQFLLSYRLKDVYEGNFTLEFSIGSYEKTLDSDDLQKIWQDIVAHGKIAGYTIAD